MDYSIITCNNDGLRTEWFDSRTARVCRSYIGSTNFYLVNYNRHRYLVSQGLLSNSRSAKGLFHPRSMSVNPRLKILGLFKKRVIQLLLHAAAPNFLDSPTMNLEEFDSMTSVLPTLDKLTNYIPKCSIKNELVSNWTVGMQIEHCLLATRGICNALVNSTPHSGKIKKGFLRRIIFLTGTIPRGRGKAPDVALPSEQATERGLRELLAEANLSAQKAAEADCECWWQHFVFGAMKRDEALRFVEIHNKHHLKIISDILSND